MSVFLHRYRVDLQTPMQMRQTTALLLTGDAMSDRIQAEVYDGGQPYTLTGSVAGQAILPNGQTQPITGAIEAPNIAYMDLPAEVYEIPGMVKITLRHVQGGVVNALLHITATVSVGVTPTVIDPHEIINLSEITTAAETAQTAAAKAEAVAGGALPKVGVVFESGGVTTANGSLSTMARRLRYTRETAPQVQAGDYIYIDPAYQCYLGLYSEATYDAAHFVGMLSPGSSEVIPAGGSPAWGSGVVPLPEAALGRWVMITISKVGHESESIAADDVIMQSLCLYMRPSLIAMKADIPALDTTLAEQGAAAEAEATGQAIAALEDGLEADVQALEAADTRERAARLTLRRWTDFTWTMGQSVRASGSVYNNATFAMTAIIPVRPGQALKNTTQDTGAGGQTTAMLLATYAGETFGERLTLAAGEMYTVPTGVDGVRILYGYPGAETPVMTWQLIRDHFALETSMAAAAPGAWNDGEVPVLVAFGASTTAGAVHHQNSDPLTYAPDNWPEYLGRIFGMEAHNLGVGTTGFMKRGERKSSNAHYGDPDYYPNICDQILRNKTLLDRAGLVVIMFGYGNDYNCGTVDANKRFPIGEYDDFYDYEAARQTVADFATAQGQVNMIEAGATLMGCLNWCVRYINTNYPLAQLVLVFGSPSANEGRSVQVSGNKLIIAPDPYETAAQSASSSAEKGIFEIETELTKLKKALGIPVVDLFYEGSPFSYYSMIAKDPADSSKYALFSTKGTAAEPTWNSHPNDAGYKYFARHLAGRIAGLFRH